MAEVRELGKSTPQKFTITNASLTSRDKRSPTKPGCLLMRSPEGKEVTIAEVMTRLDTTGRYLLIFVVADLTVPAVVGWQHHAGKTGSGAGLTVAVLSLVFLNTVFVVKLRSLTATLGQIISRRFYYVVASLAVISGLVSAAAIRLTPHRNEYINLAFSDIPLERIHPKQTALVVQFIRRNALASKQYEQLASTFPPVSPALESPESFANEGVIKSVENQFKNACDADIAYHAKLKESREEFREEMLKVDPAFLSSFDADSPPNQDDERVFDLMYRWYGSTETLYDYAAKNSKQISLRNGELQFTNQDVRAKFNQLLEESKSLHKQAIAAFNELSQKRQKLRSANGISPDAKDWH